MINEKIMVKFLYLNSNLKECFLAQGEKFCFTLSNKKVAFCRFLLGIYYSMYDHLNFKAIA